ncbi:MAG: hypothetical protein ACR2J6_06290 [Thermoleophilaceae bacterium]
MADTVEGLRSLSDTTSDTGRAIARSAATLESLGNVPVIGGEIDKTAREVRDAGEQITRQGDDTRSGIERLALLLGLSVALIPVVPVLWIYLPPRVARGREQHALERLLATGRDDPAFERLLAHRAAHNLSYRQLRQVSSEPWRDLDEGRYGELARAELHRMGLQAKALD